MSWTCFRVTNNQWTRREALNGEGAEEYPGRWNLKGTPAVYCSEHASLAQLEKLTTISSEIAGREFHLFELEIPDNLTIVQYPQNELPDNWQDHPPPKTTQEMGNEILTAHRQNGDSESMDVDADHTDCQILKIPSVVCPQENNIVLPPTVALTSTYTMSSFSFDERVF